MKHIFLMLSTFLVMPLSSFASEHTPASPQDFEIKHEQHSNFLPPVDQYTVTYKGPIKFEALYCKSEPGNQSKIMTHTARQSSFVITSEGRHRIVCYSTSDVSKHTPENKVYEFEVPQGG